MNMSIGGAAGSSFMQTAVSQVAPAAPVRGRAEDAAARTDAPSGPPQNGPPNGPPSGARPSGPPPPGAPPPGGPPPKGAGDGQKSDVSSLFDTAAPDGGERDVVVPSEENIVQALLENARLAAEDQSAFAATEAEADGADAAATKARDADMQMSEGRRAARMFESQLSVLRAAFVGEDVAVTDLRA